jgi:hypothetical protein
VESWRRSDKGEAEYGNLVTPSLSLSRTKLYLSAISPREIVHFSLSEFYISPTAKEIILSANYDLWFVHN